MTIRISVGVFTALVDDADASLADIHWTALRAGSLVYASRHGSLMHREIMNAPKGMDVDHINRNGLDNRRENLRLATRTQNLGNMAPYSNNKSGRKGVYWKSHRKKWRAQIVKNKVNVHLGYFTDLEEAAAAYDAAAIEHFGEFAFTNAMLNKRPPCRLVDDLDYNLDSDTGRMTARGGF